MRLTLQSTTLPQEAEPALSDAAGTFNAIESKPFVYRRRYNVIPNNEVASVRQIRQPASSGVHTAKV